MKKQCSLFQFYNVSNTKSSVSGQTPLKSSVKKEENLLNSGISTKLSKKNIKDEFDCNFNSEEKKEKEEKTQENLNDIKVEPPIITKNEEDDDEEIILTKRNLRKPKLMESDSDYSEGENKNGSADKENKITDAPKKENGRKKTNPTSAKTNHTRASNSSAVDFDFFNPIKEANEKNIVMDDFEDKIPLWATPEQCKDKNGKKPTDPDYDPSTLYVPPEEKKKLTPTMKQYWEIKSDNFDKVIFFKLGKFYELFYNDACIGNQHLDLNWMGKKMHVGFPEKALERYAIILVNKGFKVAIVEQTETPKQMEERLKSTNKKSGAKKDEKTIQRELVEVMTKGTYASINDPEPKYLLSVRIGYDHQIGICILESTTNYITVGNIRDDEHLTKFKTLICQIRPNEILFDPDNITTVILKILTTGYLVPLQSPLPNKQNKWHSGVAYNYLEKVYGDYNKNNWPENLKWFFEDKENRDVIFSALGGLFSYLEQVLILDKTINSARYSKYDPKIGLNKALILDSQALQHLEILESNTPISNGSSSFDGSLLSFVDKTMSFGGKRMLKRWLCAPLLSVERIEDRLNAIEDLQKYGFLRDTFRKEIGNLPDLERLCAKFYQYSIKQTTNAIYFEDVSSIRLREFHSLLKQLLKAESLIISFQDQSKNFTSKRLKNLVNFNKKDGAVLNNNFNDIYYEDADFSDEEGILPRINELINYISSLIVWQGKDKNEPAPQGGILEAYDEQMEEVEVIKKELKEYLVGIKKRFGDYSIEYCHAKYRYELEIPERLVKGTKKPEDLEFTSARAGFQRFRTEEIKEMVSRLEDVEVKLKDHLKDFAQFIFNLFRENYSSWDALNSILAEIDCLCSLSAISFLSNGIMCRPELSPMDPDVEPFVYMEDARHPCVCMTGINFIPNDIKIDSHFILFLTGPNMGGKSTILRMLCINIILAQLGCYVPARSCKLSITDRIFTRIGASDKLLEGKSTFYIEMEETLNIVKSGTRHSIAILDELGRGTSTFDGVALAYSVLKYVVEEVRCRTLFSTHYHVLIEEFRMFKEIEFFHMAAEIDEKNEKVVFLYKLKEGECHQSFGINVAKVVGISPTILKIAANKATEFEEKLSFQNITRLNVAFNNLVDSLSNCLI